MGNLKENYLGQNPTKKCKEFLEQLSIRKKDNIEFTTENSALIIIDVQNYFFKEESHAYIPASSAIINNINLLINFYKSKHKPIIFTKHIDSNPKTSPMLRWWKGTILKDSFESKIYNKINYHKDIIIEKESYDSFYKTKLEDILKKENIKQLLICGVTTNLCCESTIRSAFVRNFDSFLACDASATFSSKEHFASIVNLSKGFAQIKLTQEIINNNE